MEKAFVRTLRQRLKKVWFPGTKVRRLGRHGSVVREWLSTLMVVLFGSKLKKDEMSKSWTSKHRGPDMDFQDHRVNKLIHKPKKRKRKDVTSEEVDEAVKLFLSKGGLITKE